MRRPPKDICLSGQGFARIMRAVCCVVLMAAVSPAFAASPKKEKAKPVAGSPWRVVKIGSHDYLTVGNIAEFYGLPADVQPVEKIIHLRTRRASLSSPLAAAKRRSTGC